MAVVSKLWNVGKGTGKYFIGAFDVLIHPERPLPKTDIHPRMPAFPQTFGEWVRMAPYRHYWKYNPLIRYMVLCFFIIKIIVYNLPANTPVTHATFELLEHDILEFKKQLFYGRKQKELDYNYFMKHDPLAEHRPEWFKKGLSLTQFNYWPHGFSAKSGGH